MPLLSQAPKEKKNPTVCIHTTRRTAMPTIPAELIVAESRAEENYRLISSVVQVSELQRSNVLPLFTSCYYS
jgi:hypothetical protein